VYAQPAPLPTVPPAPDPTAVPEVPPAVDPTLVPEVPVEPVVPVVPVAPRTLGVLLPLTGSGDKLGRAAQDAITLALDGQALRVIVRDTHSDPVRAAAEAERLIGEDHVTALLGPVSRRECAAVEAVARRHGVPLVVLASVVEAPPDGTTLDPVRRLRTSPTELAAGLARHARLALGVGRVAIVHPATDAGQEAATGFLRAFVELGGVVVRTLGYKPGERSFDALMPELMGAKRPGKKVVADFDAVLVPDQGEVGLALASQLAAWGVPLRRSAGAAAGRVQLLGMAGWANPLSLDRATALTDNAVFAEPFVLEGADPAFVSAFRERFDKPPVAFHAEAFDAATWLGRALLPHEGGDATLWAAVLASLDAAPPWSGATGTVTVVAGRVSPRVHLLTIDGMTIRPRLGEDEELARRAPAPPPEPQAAP
jgi:ABC-type branched-subunit amino acid transport system substrate-binding protein